MNFADELDEISKNIEFLLNEQPRLTLDEIAEKIEKDKKVVEIILKSMYADGKIRALYIYELVDKENKED